MGNNLQQLAMNMLASNPRIANNPNAMAMVNAIKNNDSQTGQQIAQNLCKSYGVTEEQALNDAKRFFGLR